MKCNRSTNTRLISALILLSLLTGLESCGGSTDGDVTTEPDSGTTVPTETTTDIYAGLPSGNYNGAEFNILNNSFTYAEYRLDAEAINGDTFSDAVYERTRKVEDMLDVKINVTNMDYWSENAVSHINNIVMSGDDSIDACFLGVMNNISAISNGIYVDLNEIDEFDFEKPWWDMTSAKYYEIDGKLFTAHNEASANIHDSVWTCLFNKTIAKNELDEDIYQLVRDGKWTLDKMREIIEKTTHDLNGDGNMTAEDQWGLVTHNGASFGFLHGCDARGIDIENGIPYVCKVDDKLYNAILKIQNIYSMDGVMTNDKHQGSFGLTCVQEFANGNGFLLIEVLGNAASLRDMNTDFGIIPYPKYDETQSDYISYYSPAANGFCIPKTARDLSMTGTVIEVMSALGYQSVRPAYYNVVLTGKTARDNESVEMLDIIFSNIECEMSYQYQWGGYSNSLKSVMTGSGDIISSLESVREATEAAITNYIAALK